MTDTADAETWATAEAAVDPAEVVKGYNEILGDLLPIAEIDTDRRRAILRLLAHMRTQTLGAFIGYFEKFRDNAPDFYFGGEYRTGWRAGFDYLMKPETLRKTRRGIMNPEELEAIVLAGLINGGATPDAFDVIATTRRKPSASCFTVALSAKSKAGTGERHDRHVVYQRSAGRFQPCGSVSNIPDPGNGTESERLCRENGAGMAEPQNGGIVAIWRGWYP